MSAVTSNNSSLRFLQMPMAVATVSGLLVPVLMLGSVGATWPFVQAGVFISTSITGFYLVNRHHASADKLDAFITVGGLVVVIVGMCTLFGYLISTILKSQGW